MTNEIIQNLLKRNQFIPNAYNKILSTEDPIDFSFSSYIKIKE